MRHYGMALLLMIFGLSGSLMAVDSWLPAVAAGDIDTPKCTVEREGKVIPGSREEILAALGLAEGPGWTAGERHRGKDRIEIRYTLRFVKPLAIGTVMVREVSLIEAEVEGVWKVLPVNPRTIGSRSVATLDVGEQVTALRFTQAHANYDPLGLSLIRLLRSRLANLAPGGIANAEKEYTEFHMFSPPTLFAASRIPAASGAWRNTGLVGGADKISSPPISTETSTWFMISWVKPVTLAGLHLDSNISALTLYEYTGPEGVNPAVSTSKEWRKVRGGMEEGPFWGTGPVFRKDELSQRGWGIFKAKGSIERTLRFAEPLTTRGLKIQIEGVQPIDHRDTDQVASIQALHAYSPLGEGPLPSFAEENDTPPFAIETNLATAGTLTLVVDTPDGRRLRNLVAREGREAGPQKVGWNLKGDDGQLVAPGTYPYRGITGPAPTLTYEMTPYPNVRNFHPENTPWRNGHSGTGGWLADHSPPRCVATAGDRVYLGAPVCESGEALIECSPDGKRLWGHGNFLAFTGPSLLAANDATVFVGTPVKQIPYTTKWRELIFAVDAKTRKTLDFLDMESTHNRQRGMVGLAADAERVYVSVRARSSWLVNAMEADDVDIEQCLPRYKEMEKSNKQFNPNPRNEFLRLLRLTGTPPGQHGSLNVLESSDMPSRRNHLVVAFKRAVPIGSLVFPFPIGDYSVTISVLKADAPYPPDPEKNDQWNAFFQDVSPGREDRKDPARGWAVLPAPIGCVTRALRITFDRAEDELDELMDDGFAAGGGSRAPWKGTLDGLKILRRRYENLFPTAVIRVNSGPKPDAVSGTWDAGRSEALSEANPGIYALEWETPQEVRGLAIKEIDGNDIRIDVFEGSGPIDIKKNTGWKEVATYVQPRRYFYNPDANRNPDAAYMDGYVDFGETIKTRAVRIRVLSQWTTREEGRAGLYGVRQDRGGMEMVPSRCHVYGVAPLKALGGEPPSDPLMAERLEVFDTQKGALIKELPFPAGGRLALRRDGVLFGISDNKVFRVDLEKGEHSLFTSDPAVPDGMAFDREGQLYVFDRGEGRQNVRVYSADGTYLRSIGKPGGIKMGTWDPERIGLSPETAVDLAIDGRDQLWIVAAHSNPKRQSVWSLDGKHLRDHLGNTGYGGGGVLNPWNKRQLFYAAENATLEFELDWETGLTRLKAIPWLGDAAGGELPVKVGNNLYVCTRPNMGRMYAGIVYLYKEDRMVPVAAMGAASSYPPLRTPEIVASLGNHPLGKMDFLWSDLNGDTRPQLDEVTFHPKRFEGLGWFDRALGVQAGRIRFEVTDILPNGVPRYTRREWPEAPAEAPGVKLSNGLTVFFGGWRYLRPPAEIAFGADGKRVWEYSTEGYGVHAITKATAWAPSQVVSEFDIIGFDRAHSGELGDFFVTNSNIGRWNLWTADGLLAGELMRDRRDPGALPWSMPEGTRGMALPGLTPGEEHFSGYACRTYEDNKYYLVAGHNHISLLEIHGLEQYRRLSGQVTVTAEDIRRVQEWERERQTRKVYAEAPVYRCGPADGFVLDGKLEDWSSVAPLAVDGTTFQMAYSATTLYLAYQVNGQGPFKNTGNDWRRMFKSGAGVDLMMRVKAGEDREKDDLEEGDFRLLITPNEGVPMGVIYQPNLAGASKDEAWETHTLVFSTAFDRVARLPEVKVAVAALENGYVVEAAVPLSAIGLTITEGLRLKFDWGVLKTSPGGTEVLARRYWANRGMHMISDEAAEARLQPSLWGHVIFVGKSTDGAPDLLGTEKGPLSEEDVLDLLEEE